MRALLLPIAVLAAALPGAAETLDNGVVRLTVDDGGNLTELTNLATGHNYAAGKPLWALFYRRGDAVEKRAAVEASRAHVSRQGEALVIRYDQVGDLAVTVEMEARLAGDEVRWSAALTSREPSATVTEFHFPLVGACRFRADQALIWSSTGGQRFEDPRARIRRAHTAYRGSDQNGIQMFGTYPGLTAATNSFAFAGARQGLYFGSHDPTFQHTLHLFTLRGEDVGAGFVKYPFLDQGKTYRVTGYVLSPYSGSWHAAARKYRAWANTWYKPVRKPDWVRRMTGWQRVILKHQNGDILHPYREIPQIGADGLAAGIPSVLLFGWWKAGMDHDYPNYVCDESQGGCEALRAEIGRARRQGARIQVYFNGNFIDPASDYCRLQGCPETVKDLRGLPQLLNVTFPGDGTLTHAFLSKYLYWTCPAAREWREKLHAFADKAVGLGADAVFFDSMGGATATPCTDPRHGHPTPFTTIGIERAHLFRELRERIKAKGPELAIGTEIPGDVVAQHADFVHGITGVGNLIAAPAGGPPKTESFLEWYRYIFPEMSLSEREIYDDRDVERRVDRALMLGMISDVDVWRCRGTVRDTPLYREYLTRANAIRTRFGVFLLDGEYRDTELFENSNPQIEARSFRAGGRIAVVLTQSWLANASTLVTVPGYSLVEHGGLGRYAAAPAEGGVKVELPRHALAVAVFARK